MQPQTDNIPATQAVTPPQFRFATHYRHEVTGRGIPCALIPPSTSDINHGNAESMQTDP